MGLFELACAAVIAVTLAIMLRLGGRAVLADYALLALAGWVGEQSSIALYHHYAYAPGWHLFAGYVPLLIPLIWPLVILSARQVVEALGAPPRWRWLAAGGLVLFDAALVEVVATAAGLWSWVEPGHLGVPLIGVLGWGYFAAAASWMLDRRRPAARLAVVALAPAATHALLVASWWGGLRWVLRGRLEPGSVVAVSLVAAVLALGASALRRRGRAVGLAVAGPRVLAASLFVALLFAPGVATLPLLICALAAATPYLVATRLAGEKEVGGQPRLEPQLVAGEVEQEQGGAQVG